MKQSKSNENDDIDQRNQRGESFNTITGSDRTSDVDTNEILTPEMIQDHRIKAIEHERRIMARQQHERKQAAEADGGVALNNNGSNENQNGESRKSGHAYPSQLDKYWDKQFGRDRGNFTNNISFASRSSDGSASLDHQPDVTTPPTDTAPKKKKKKKKQDAKKDTAKVTTRSTSVPVAPGAYAQVGPGGDVNISHTAELDAENGTETSNVVEANKVDDAEAIVDATDVRRDNFRRYLVVGTVLVIALAVALGLYYGLKSGRQSDCDDFCCDPSEVPVGHLPLVSCSCFDNSKLARRHKGYSEKYFNKTKEYMLKFLEKEREKGLKRIGFNSSFINTTMANIRKRNGKSCNRFDQVLLMFSNSVSFKAYMEGQRSSVRNSYLMLASLFVETSGKNWTFSEGWFDAKADDEERRIDFGLCDWFGLECLYPPNLVNYINLRENNLVGSLPVVIFMFSRLQEFDVSGNNGLKGKLPTELGLLSELTSLSIAQTAMTGRIPTELMDIPQLHELTLSGGYNCSGFKGGKQGISSSFFDNQFLRSIDLSFNDLGTTLPSGVGDATNLQMLNLVASGLTGQLPTEIAKLSSLKVLDLSYNKFDSGATIPTEYVALSELEFLNVAYSGLDETIPEDLCKNVDFSKDKLRVASSCNDTMCSCCRRVGDKNAMASSTEDYKIDVTCVESKDAHGILDDCKD